MISTSRGSKGIADTDFIMENIQTHSAWKCFSSSESDEDAPNRKWKYTNLILDCSCNHLVNVYIILNSP